MRKTVLAIIILLLILVSLSVYYLYSLYSIEQTKDPYFGLKDKALRIYRKILYELNMLNRSLPNIDRPTLFKELSKCPSNGTYEEVKEEIHREYIRNKSLPMTLDEFQEAKTLIGICINVSEGLPVNLRPTEAKALYYICGATLIVIHFSGKTIKNLAEYRGLINELENEMRSKNCIIDNYINSTCIESQGSKLLGRILEHIKEFYITYKLIYNLIEDGYLSLNDIGYIKDKYLNRLYDLLENLSRIFEVYDKYFLLLWGECAIDDIIGEHAYLDFAEQQLSRVKRDIDTVENYLKRNGGKVKVDEDYFLENIELSLTDFIGDITHIAIYLYNLGYANYVMYNYQYFNAKYSIVNSLLGEFNASCLDRSMEDLLSSTREEIHYLSYYMGLLGLKDFIKYRPPSFGYTSIRCRTCQYVYSVISLAIGRAGYNVYTFYRNKIVEYKDNLTWKPIISYINSITRSLHVLSTVNNYTGENLGYEFLEPIDIVIGYHESAIRTLNYKFSYVYTINETYQKLVSNNLSVRQIERFIEDMLNFYREINATKIMLFKAYLLAREYLNVLPLVINNQITRINAILSNCRGKL